jgi:hypothetical protein
MKRTLLLLPLWSSVLFSPPAVAKTAAAQYEARYVIAGFLVRSAQVCSGDWMRTLGTAHEFVGGEYRALARSSPQIAATWLNEGGDIFNSEASKAGKDAACSRAASARDRAQALLESGR